MSNYPNNSHIEDKLDHNTKWCDLPVQQVFQFDHQPSNVIQVGESRDTGVGAGVTTNGEYISKEKIDYWKETLNELIFYSPHSSFIINFNYIKSFNRKSLILSYSNSNVEISIAAKKQQEFRTKMFLFAERGI